MSKKGPIIILTRSEEHFKYSFYFKNLKYGIDTALYDKQFETVMLDQGTDLKEYLFSNEIQPSGILSLAPNVNDKSLQVLERLGIPVVLVNCRSENMSWVDTDNILGASIMTEHLIKKGHSRILMLSGFLESQNSIDRMAGYNNTLLKHGIKYNPDLVLSCDFSITLSYEKMCEYMEERGTDGFTAIFAGNDLMVVGALRALTDRGLKVPDDIAVVGYDDFEFSSTYAVPITTYKQPFYNVAFVATRFLLKQIEAGNDRLQQAELTGEIVIRESCGYKLR